MVVLVMESETYYCKICGAKLVPGARFCSRCGTAVTVGTDDNRSTATMHPFQARLIMRQRILRLIEQFRAKGALSPETAMSATQLGLGPRFELAMQRRLGRTGIFVKIDNKYYLSEERLEEARRRLAARRGR